MSQTLHTFRTLRTRYKNHWHKLHLIVIEDCDIEDDLTECSAGNEVDEEVINDIWKAVYKVIGFIPELEH